MKKKIIVLSVLLLVMLTLGDPFNNARFKVVVLDEQAQRPLSGIKLRGGFTGRYPRWENASVDHSVDMQTDVNGICRFAGRTNCGEAYFIVRQNSGFLYYFNPTPNDRNLEWDRKTNLNTAERYDLEMLQP